jgi:hypothetical protein
MTGRCAPVPELPGTTTSSLKLTTAMRGWTITGTVGAVLTGYHDGRATSAPVTVQT